MKTEKISLSQLTILTAIFTFGTSILVIASILAMQVDQDAWIASIVGMSFNMLLIFLYIGLIKFFPGLTLTQMIEAITGKTISFLYVCYFFVLTVYLIRLVGSFIVSAIFPETPIFVIYLTFTLVVAIAVRYGLETFSRAAELFAPFIVVFFLFIFITLLPQTDSRMIQPFFEAGFKPIMSAGFQIAAIQEHICLLMLIPSVTRSKRVPKALLLGTLIGSIIIVFVTTISMLVLGPEITARNLFPALCWPRK
ncbi:GerAB/ArcD/ProY family transporter [Paenibacillus xylanivorans]|uniref:GerAB/ArcD/ProY family transporter n=1 Tax=Paenibacillus xylanivorans TaxID=1705561 RepID=UPI0009E8872A|nr:GerAB/ArcD/ProY family transporter [Paenibacillus xylanivorans]